MKLLDAWRSYWFTPESLLRLAVFRMLVLTLALSDMLAYSTALLRNADLAAQLGAPAHWSPLLALDALGLGPIDPSNARLLIAVGVVAAVCGIVGLFSNLSCLIASLSSAYISALVYSFEKVHHDKAALTLTLFALTLAPIGARASVDALLRDLWRAARGSPEIPTPQTGEFAHFPIRFAQVSLAVGYCAAGLSKLVIGGPRWLNGYTLMAYLAEFNRPWTAWLVGDVQRIQLFSVGAIALQVSFPIVLFRPRLAWVYLPGVALFHIVNWMTMDTGPYLTLWFLTIAFVPFERVPQWVREQLQTRAFARLGSALLVVAPLASVVAWLWFAVYFPRWTLVVWIPLAAGAWFYLQRAEPLIVRFTASCPYSRTAAAAMRVFDWAQRLRFEPLDHGVRGFRSFQAERAGVARHGARAWIAIARELPLVALLARFAPLGRGESTGARA